MTLREAAEGQEYVIRELHTGDAEVDAFLFSLGCYVGEHIAVVLRRKGGCVVSVKNGRYSIDDALANAIVV